MTKEQLMQASILLKRIEGLKEINEYAKNQKCEWIQFTYRNGSSFATVCDNEKTIELVRRIIISENEANLKELESEFNSL